MNTPHKTDRGRALIAQKQRELPQALRSLLIVVDGKRDLRELARLSQGLGLGEAGVQVLIERGLVEMPPPAADPRIAIEQAKRLVRAKFFALDLVTRMLAGREADLRLRAREVDTESRFEEWIDLCCERIEEHADVERAGVFRERVAAQFSPAPASV